MKLRDAASWRMAWRNLLLAAVLFHFGHALSVLRFETSSNAVRGAATESERRLPFLSSGKGASQQEDTLSIDSHVENIAAQVDVPYSSYSKAEAVNPWHFKTDFRALPTNMNPVAPKSAIQPGIEAQGGYVLPPSYKDRAVLYPTWEDHPHAFPAETSTDLVSRSQHLHVGCQNSPVDWTDRFRKPCEFYTRKEWCTPDGKEGPGWNYAWGLLIHYASGGVSASHACCACGGGVPHVETAYSSEPLSARRLIASADRLPDSEAKWFERNFPYIEGPERPLRPVQAPEDRVPVPVPVDAPADIIPAEFSRYLAEVHRRTERSPDLAGLSARYYSFLPHQCSKADASGIDRSLDYGVASEAMGKRLGWPVQGYGRQPPGVFWGKWTGTLQVFLKGVYVFELNLGTATESTLRVDGVTLLTQGQCYAARKEGQCNAIGCRWTMEGLCKVPPPSEAGLDVMLPPATSPFVFLENASQANASVPVAANASGPVEAPVVGNASLWGGPAPDTLGEDPFVEVPPPFNVSGREVVTLNFTVGGISYDLISEDEYAYLQFEGVIKKVISDTAGFGIAPEDVTISCSPGSVRVDAEVLVPLGVDPNAVAAELHASRVLLQQDLQSAIASIPEIKRFMTSAITVSRIDVDGQGVPPVSLVPGTTNTLFLQPGSHCIEALVMIPTSMRTLQLRYQGADTNGRRIPIPGTVLYCDPVIPACASPALQACPRYTPRCQTGR